MKKRDVVLAIILILCGIAFIMCMVRGGGKEVKEETQIEYEARVEKRAAELAAEPRMELRYNADGSSEWVNANE